MTIALSSCNIPANPIPMPDVPVLIVLVLGWGSHGLHLQSKYWVLENHVNAFGYSLKEPLCKNHYESTFVISTFFSLVASKPS